MTQATDAGARTAWLWRNRAAFGQTHRGELPRLLVDVSAILRLDAQTGIQRVVRAVWSELAKRAGTNFIAQPIFATNRRGYCYAPTDFLDNRLQLVGAVPVGMGSQDKFLGLDLSAHLLPKYRAQLRAWRANGASAHVVVYDLLPLKHPDWFTEAATVHFRRWYRVVVEDADQIICISNQVAREIVDSLGVRRRPTIGRLQMSGDIAASRPSSGMSLNVSAVLNAICNRPAVLMVGTVEPRKGYDVALAAFEHLWRTRPKESPDLVIIGKGGWKTSALQSRLLGHPERGTRLHWLDRVSDEGLSRFYETCKGLLVTSRGEGFGLPLIEAQAHRRHVLARDLPVFREQNLPNALYFDDERPSALASKIMDLVGASGRRASSARLPTWGEAVDRMLFDMGFGQHDRGDFTSGFRHAS